MSGMRVRRTTTAVAAVAAVATVLAACGGGGGGAQSVVDKAKNEKKIVIGVKYEQPGLGLKTGAGVEGFDVDVGKYIAGKLGVPESGITFKEARSANREQFLANRTVDLVIATYSITEKRKPKVTFAGPYYVAAQDIMVRPNDNSIKSFDDLKGKRVCQVAGSNSWENITKGPNKLNKTVDVELVPAQGYEECMTKLKGGSIDVVTTDNVILAGYAQREGPGAFKIVNAPFTDEKYGVGIKKGDLETCEAVNRAITEMYADGTAAKLLEKWFGPAGLKYSTTQPPVEGCS